MGLRISKQKSARAKKAVNQQKSADLSTKNFTTKLGVVTEQKNGTINGIDFFGFPAALFIHDLQTTGWATLVVLVILGVITWLH